MTTQGILEAARGAKAALALADGTVRAQALRSMAAQLCSPANITAILPPTPMIWLLQRDVSAR